MQFDNQKTRNVADVVAKILAGETVSEELKGNQHKIDANKNNKIDAHDFKLLRAKKKVEEETELTESHFKVGDEVICKASGMEGEVVKLDEPQTGKYYTVKREDGKMVKYAPDELKLEDEDEDEEDDKKEMKESAGASKDTEEKFHKKLDTLVHKTFGKRKEEMKEEVESLDEIFDKSDPIGTKKRTAKGIATKTATGVKHENVPEKDVEAGSTDWDKEEKLAKTHLSPKPNRKKYGARQNYVRSTRVNESFSGLLGVYKEGGLKALAEALVKEEPTNDEYKAELEDAKAKAEGKKKQPNLAAAATQGVKNMPEEYEILDADEINGVQIDTIEEKTLTEPETKKKEEVVKSMKKGMEGFKARYGDRAKEVMYATATKIAKEKA